MDTPSNNVIESGDDRDASEEATRKHPGTAGAVEQTLVQAAAATKGFAAPGRSAVQLEVSGQPGQAVSAPLVTASPVVKAEQAEAGTERREREIEEARARASASFLQESERSKSGEGLPRVERPKTPEGVVIREIESMGLEADGRRVGIENLVEQAEEQDASNKLDLQTGDDVDFDAQRATEREKEHQAQLVAALNKQFLAVGDKYHFRDQRGKVAFVDQGTRFASAVNDERVAKAMVVAAEAKGWKTIRVSGHPDFARHAWMEARMRGLEVQGYKPQAHELAELQERQEKARTNRVEPVADRTSAAGHNAQAKVVGAAAAAVISKVTQDPAVQAALRTAVEEKLGELQRSGQVPAVPIYDAKAPPAKSTERVRPVVERNSERTR